MATEVYTDGMHAHAETLYARRHKWAEGQLNGSGLVFYLFNSSKVGKDGLPKLYHAVRDGSWCDCPGFNFRRQCAHSIACKRAAEEVREAACRPRIEDLMDAHQSEGRRQLVDAF